VRGPFDCRFQKNEALPPQVAKKARTVLARLTVAGSVMFTTLYLLGWGALAMLERAVEGTDPNRGFITHQFARADKSIDFAQLNGGDWSFACLIGGPGGGHARLVEYAAKANIHLPVETRSWTAQKSRPTLGYITKAGEAKSFWPVDLERQIAGGEVVCVEPSAPFMALPTKQSRETLWK
jgi:hypothetical protein